MQENILIPAVSPTNEPNPTSPEILGLAKAITARPNNIISIVVDKTKNNGLSENNIPSSRLSLVRLTERIAADAKSGVLKGLGVFAEYEDGYSLELEGSYLQNPEAAVLPIERLKRRIMDQIEHED